MPHIAVMGDRDSVYGFAALGFHAYDTETEDVSALFSKLCRSDYGIIYITEEAAAQIPAAIQKQRMQITPAVVLIPGTKNNTGAGITGIREAVKKAVGSDILSDKEYK